MCSSEDYLSLSEEQRKWFFDFQNELLSVEQLNSANETILRTRAIGLTNLKRARGSSGSICVNDEDGDDSSSGRCGVGGKVTRSLLFGEWGAGQSEYVALP